MSEAPIRFVGTTRVPSNAICELEWSGSRDYSNPWAEIELDVEFTDPDGQVRTVPAFWAGGRTWRVRYSSPIEGVHRYQSQVRGPAATGFEDLGGEITVTGYSGSNPLLLHGGPTVAQDGRHLAHADGEPFFWLADAWYTAMTARFRWPDTFQRLADDRAAKGYTVVQIVAGLVPEFLPFSHLMASEGGQPWLNHGKGRINPAYYSVPDVKIDYLVGKGIAPCIIGGWGHYARLLGREGVMQHWRYLVARYAAYPVVWCIAGEADLAGVYETMASIRETLGTAAEPLPQSADGLKYAVEAFVADPRGRAEQIAIWEDASKLVREIDPFDRMRSVGPTGGSSGDVFTSRGSFDLDMLQTGHAGAFSVPFAMNLLHASFAHGDKPVLDHECSFEGIFDANWQDVQRFQFWSHMLSGAAGYSYGTMPINIFNSKTDPHVPLSRVSMHYWEDAIDWVGAKHVAVGKRILERFPWWQLQPTPGAIEPHAGPDDWFRCYAASLPTGTMIVYLPSLPMTRLGYLAGSREEDDPSWFRFWRLTLNDLRPETRYRVTYIDPRSGEEHLSSFTFLPNEGRHVIESPHFWNAPTGEDWLMLVEPLHQLVRSEA